jgi:hypothetical protein
MATAKKTTKKTSAKKTTTAKAKKPVAKSAAKEETRPAPKKVGVVDADMRSAIAVVRHGIRNNWDDEKITATVIEKFPGYNAKRIKADLNWHRSPKHASCMEKGLGR